MQKSLILASLLFCCFSVHSQSTLGFNLNGFIPVGELKKDSPEIWGGGFSVDFAAQMKDSPIHLGGLMSVTRYGSEVRKGDHGPNLRDVRVRRNNELISMLGFIRLKPTVSGSFQPYADFLTGFSYIFTRAHYRDNSLNEPFDSVMDINDFVFNYGAGGGIEIFIDEYISFDISLRALRSSRANYLTSESVAYDIDNEVYHMEIRRSRFNHVTIGFGIKILFSELN
ncbi:MAG: hypothetical protein ACJAXB_001873 [Candidatus Endobugula sp.]|jgi:hypothetical protein